MALLKALGYILADFKFKYNAKRSLEIVERYGTTPVRALPGGVKGSMGRFLDRAVRFGQEYIDMAEQGAYVSDSDKKLLQKLKERATEFNRADGERLSNDLGMLLHSIAVQRGRLLG